jgi:riboflavin biosynthesis pyrimidine reductase
MRKVILSAAITLDGCIARPDGSVDYLTMTKERNPRVQGFTAHNNASTVISLPMPSSAFSPPASATEFFTNQSPATWLRKNEQARSFLQSDLIDELSLGIVPILRGNGLPLFPGAVPQRDFPLVENKTYSKNQILLTYQRVRSKGKRK